MIYILALNHLLTVIKPYVEIALYSLLPIVIFATGFVVRYNYYAFNK